MKFLTLVSMGIVTSLKKKTMRKHCKVYARCIDGVIMEIFGYFIENYESLYDSHDNQANTAKIYTKLNSRISFF